MTMSKNKNKNVKYKLLDKVLDSASRFKTLDSVQQEKVINSQNPPIPEPMLSIL